METKRIAILQADEIPGTLVIGALLRSEIPAAELCAIVKDSTRSAHLAEKEIEVRAGSYDIPESMRIAFSGVEKLVFILGSLSDNESRIREQTEILLAARSAGISHIVLTSFIAPDLLAPGTENIEYATEYLIRSLGFTFTFLRNRPPHQEADVHHLSLYSLLPVRQLFPDLTCNENEPVSCEELALIVAGVLTDDRHINRTYGLGSPDYITLRELASMIF